MSWTRNLLTPKAFDEIIRKAHLPVVKGTDVDAVRRALHGETIITIRMSFRRRLSREEVQTMLELLKRGDMTALNRKYGETRGKGLLPTPRKNSNTDEYRLRQELAFSERHLIGRQADWLTRRAVRAALIAFYLLFNRKPSTWPKGPAARFVTAYQKSVCRSLTALPAADHWDLRQERRERWIVLGTSALRACLETLLRRKPHFWEGATADASLGMFLLPAARNAHSETKQK